MQIEVIRDFSKFQGMRAEWNALLEQSGTQNPFLRHEWLTAWWKGYGKDKKLFVICCREDDRLVGAAPFMEYKTRFLGIDQEIVGFMANHWSRLDLVVDSRQEQCLEHILNAIVSSKKIVVLAEIDAASGNLATLKDILRSRKVRHCVDTKQHTFMELAGSWEEYLGKQSKNFRSDHKKKIKRLEKIGKVSLEVEGRPTEHVLEEMGSVASESWQSKQGVNIVTQPQGYSFYRALGSQNTDVTALDFSVLKAGAEPVAYLVGLRQDRQYFAFDTAYRKEFERFSPGMLLHYLLLERLHKEGVKILDFGYVADYKKRWTEEFVAVEDLVIFPETLLGRCFYMIYRLKKGSVKGDKNGKKQLRRYLSAGQHA